MTKLPKTKVSVSVSISLDLLSEIDDIAYSKNESRSEFIVKSIAERIERIEEK